MTTRSLAILPLLMVLLAGPSPAGAEGDVPRVVVVPLDGASVEGAIESVKDGALKLSGRADPIPLGQVRTIRFPPAGARSALALPGPRVRLVLRGEETLRGTFVQGGTDAIELKPDDLAPLRVPFDSIRRVESEAAHKNACEIPTKGRPPRPGTDLVYTTSGDAVAGTWVEASPAGLVMEAAGLPAGQKGRKTTIAWADLVLLHVDEAALPPPAGLVAEIDTVAGSRLVAEKVEGDARSWKATTRAGVTVEVPVSAIAEARFSGGAFVYATEIPFRSTYKHFYDDDKPQYNEMQYGVRVDRVFEGCPLTVKGVAYRHGFATHSKSTVTIPLAKAFTRFEALVGIDDLALKEPAAPWHGDAVARVTADGKEVWTSGAAHLKGGEAPRAVGPIDVSGVAELVLEVDFGDGFHMNDRVDWLEPLLVRAK